MTSENSKKAFKDVFNNLDVGYYKARLDGTIIEHNPAVNIISGYDPSISFVGAKTRAFWDHIEEQEEYLNLLKKNGFVKNYLLHVTTPKGKKLAILTNSRIFSDQNNQPLYIEGTFIAVTEVERIKQKLKESKQRFEKVLYSLHDAVFIVDSKTVEILDCNPAATDIFGYKREEMIGRITTFLHINKDHLEEFRKVLYPAIEKHGFLKNFEFRMKRKDGTIFDTEHSVFPLLDDNEKRIGWVSLVRDNTERKKVVEKLKKEKQEKSIILENVLEHIIFQDLNHSIIYLNKAACDSVNQVPEKLIGRKCHNIWHNSDKVCENCPVELSFKTKKPETNEMITPDGRIWIIKGNPIHDEKGNLIGAVEVTNEITEQRKMEQELIIKNIEQSVLNRIITLGNESQSLQEFLEKSYERVLDAVGFDRGGVYLYNAETQHNILVLHKNVHPDFITAVEDVDISKGLFSRVFDKNEPFYIEDFSKFMKSSKELGVYSAAIVPLRSKDEYVGSLNVGSPVHHVLSHNELELLVAIGNQMGIVIQKFKSEKLLKKSEEKYREAYSRANFYKDLFAHDINNILQNIISASELSSIYLNNAGKREKLSEAIDIVKEQVKKGASLISKIRKLSEIEETLLILEPTNICEVLKNSIEYSKKSFQSRDINIEINSFSEKIYIQANSLVSDLVENIIINGITHNRSPKIEINIKISKKQQDGNNYIKIEFVDNGVGIPDDQRKFIFEKKTDGYESGRGMGLGLSLVKKIIDSYNGQIWVEDRVGGDYSKGSNFVLLIPEAE